MQVIMHPGHFAVCDDLESLPCIPNMRKGGLSNLMLP
jgi:hypothetical protein